MRLLSIALALSFVGVATGPIRASADPVKYWVFLTDKQDVAGKTSLVPITERAMGRRLTRGAAMRSREIDRDVSPEYMRRLADVGVKPIVTSRWLNAVSAWLEPGQVESVSRLPFVRAVRPVAVVRPERAPLLPLARTVATSIEDAVTVSEHPLTFDYGPSLTQMNLVGAVTTVEAGWNGSGVLLGIIDTGWGPLTHPAIKPILDSGRLLGDRDFTGFADDLNRHALAVLGMAAGFDPGFLIGPAYGATILHARTEYAPTETNQEEDNFVAGLEWMESEGVDVVNVSLGYSTFDLGERSYAYADMDGDTPVTTRVADLAVSLGVVMVNSAGNEGCPSPSLCWFYITSPADGDSVLTVGSVDQFGRKSGFSSFGPTADGRIKPDVAAMGENTTVPVESAGNNGYTIFGNGTSFASPMVAGVVAQLLQADPGLTPMQIHQILKNTGSQANAPNNELGWGIIDAEAAMSVVTAREEVDVPAQLILSAWPNPFAESFRVAASIPGDARAARLEVFDSLGRLLATYENGAAQGSTWRFDVDGRSFPNGILHFKLTAGDRAISGSVVRSK